MTVSPVAIPAFAAFPETLCRQELPDQSEQWDGGCSCTCEGLMLRRFTLSQLDAISFRIAAAALMLYYVDCNSSQAVGASTMGYEGRVGPMIVLFCSAKQ